MAFQMEPDSWEDAFNFPQPSGNDWVIMQCRTNKRASWAAQLAADAGLTNCLIYKQVSAVCKPSACRTLDMHEHCTTCKPQLLLQAYRHDNQVYTTVVGYLTLCTC